MILKRKYLSILYYILSACICIAIASEGRLPDTFSIPLQTDTILHDSLPENNTVTDRDSNTYRIVKIGDRWWMAENLRVCSCTDSTTIKSLKIGMSDEKTPVLYWYDNAPQSKYSKIFGPLYNWIAIRECDLCPEGWHIPSKDEWLQLYEIWRYLDREKKIERKYYENYTGFQLRATGDDLWPNNHLATNITGFSALPGGLVAADLWYIRYFRNRGSWWTSSSSENMPYLAQIGNDFDGLWVSRYSFSYSNSIRCIKDEHND